MNTLQADFFTYYKNLDEAQRAEIANEMNVINPEGHVLTEKNCAFLAFQSQIKFSVVAGFKQWLEHGRCVKKGQHGNFIFIPAMTKVKKVENGKETVSEELDKFLLARVFDISQTFEMKDKEQKEEVKTELEPAF